MVRSSLMSVRVCTRWVNSTSSVARVRSSAKYPMAPITTSKTKENTVPKYRRVRIDSRFRAFTALPYIF